MGARRTGLDLHFGFWLVMFFTAWAYVLQPGKMSLAKETAAAWLVAQCIGFLLQRHGVGLAEEDVFRAFSVSRAHDDTRALRRALAAICHLLLDHFSLIQWPKGAYARGVAVIPANRKPGG